MIPFSDNKINLFYKENKELELNPLIELYRGKTYLNILKNFISNSLKSFNKYIFSIKKSHSRTLTNILSNWMFTLYSNYDFNDDSFFPSNYSDTSIIRIIFLDLVKHDKELKDVDKKIDFVLNNLVESYKNNLSIFNSYVKSEYYKNNKNNYDFEIELITKENIIFYKINILLKFVIKDFRLKNILNSIFLPKIVYNRCKKRFSGPSNKFHEYLWIILLRYQLLGSNNNQLGVLPDVLNLMKKDFFLNFECFASAINSYNKNYCSIYYDVEKYFGSKGSFFNLKCISGTYSFNPPYQINIINRGIKRIISFLDNSGRDELTFILTIPIWDINGKNEMKEKHKYNNYEIDYGDFDIINEVKKSKYFIGLKMIFKNDFTYLDHNFNLYKDITIQNTYIIILSNNKEKDFMSKINNYSYKYNK